MNEENHERPLVSVIVPVFNEEDCLTALHERLSAALRGYGKPYEVLFVDDGSRDGSFDRLRWIHESDQTVRVVRFVRNFGQQMAVSAGFQHVRGDRIVLIDADLQTLPEEIPLLLNKLDEGYDIVYGVRERRSDPLLRRAGSWCMSKLLYRITGIDVPDAASGFIALDRRFVDSINLFNERSKYFNGLFAWLSYGRWASVPVTHQARIAGHSKYNLRGLISLTLNFVCSFSDAPLRFAGYAGAACATLGAAVLLLLLVLSLSGVSGTATPFWALAALMVLLCGVQLISIGILGSYLARVYTETKGRPHFVIRDVLDHATGSDADA